jgi:hypothetical protein
MGHRPTRYVAIVDFAADVSLLPALYNECKTNCKQLQEANPTLLQSTFASLIQSVDKVSTGRRSTITDAVNMSQLEVFFWKIPTEPTGMPLPTHLQNRRRNTCILEVQSLPWVALQVTMYFQ